MSAHVIWKRAAKDDLSIFVTANATQGSFEFDTIDDGNAGSGIRSAEFCLGRASNNCLVNEWKAIDISDPGKKVLFDIAKTVECGSVYYVNLRATDMAGNIQYMSSTPTLVDLNAPTWSQWQITRTDTTEDECNSVKLPHHRKVVWQIRQDLVCTCVRGLDDATMVQMQLRVQGVDGTKVDLQEIPKPFTMPLRFSPRSDEAARVVCFKPKPPALLKPDAYVVELQAQDMVGHRSDWQSNGELVVDTTPPTMGRVREHLGDAHEADCMTTAGKNMTIHVDWDGFEGKFPSRV